MGTAWAYGSPHRQVQQRTDFQLRERSAKSASAQSMGVRQCAWRERKKNAAFSRGFSRRSAGKGVAEGADVLTSRVTHRSAMLTPRVIWSSAVARSMGKPVLARMTSSTPAEFSLLGGRRSSDAARVSRAASLRRLGGPQVEAGAWRASAPIPAVSAAQSRVPSSAKRDRRSRGVIRRGGWRVERGRCPRIGRWAQEGGPGITRSQ